jgi:hypothetical protein
VFLSDTGVSINMLPPSSRFKPLGLGIYLIVHANYKEKGGHISLSQLGKRIVRKNSPFQGSKAVFRRNSEIVRRMYRNDTF